MNVRERIAVAGLPFIWSTNLDDDALREFYQVYGQRIHESEAPTEQVPGIISIPLRMAFLEFREGVCLWTCSGRHHTVLYRSNRDWEIWNARHAEIQELREEQAAEKAAQCRLLAVEDAHLREKADLLIKAEDYDTAAACVHARAEMRLAFNQSQGVPSLWSLWRSEFPLVFTRFPISTHGIAFLRKYDPTPQAFTNFAHWYAAGRCFRGEQSIAETGRIYDEAMKLFPNAPRIFKAATLFWRRVGQYDLALRICSEALKKGLRDATKSGFEGRLRRLEKEASRNQAPSMVPGIAEPKPKGGHHETI